MVQIPVRDGYTSDLVILFVNMIFYISIVLGVGDLVAE